MSKKNSNLIVLVEGAIIAAVAMALSWIPIEAPNAAFDLSLGLIPLAVYATRRGVGPAVAVGAVWGLLHLVGGKAYILTPLQFIFEYPFAFAFGGLFGVFAGKIRRSIADGGSPAVKWIVCASFAAAVSRWFWHFLAGGIVWAEYAPDTMNPWLYSLIMNGLSCIGNGVMLAAVMAALCKASPRLFKR